MRNVSFWHFVFRDFPGTETFYRERVQSTGKFHQWAIGKGEDFNEHSHYNVTVAVIEAECGSVYTILPSDIIFLDENKLKEGLQVP